MPYVFRLFCWWEDTPARVDDERVAGESVAGYDLEVVAIAVVDPHRPSSGGGEQEVERGVASPILFQNKHRRGVRCVLDDLHLLEDFVVDEGSRVRSQEAGGVCIEDRVGTAAERVVDAPDQRVVGVAADLHEPAVVPRAHDHAGVDNRGVGGVAELG
jgi:hypothetical protein